LARRARGRSGRLRRYFRSLGPGIVTGAADDDPSGIAAYSQVGAQFGYGILWTTLLSLPLMIAVQQITAEIGRVTGRGVGYHMRRTMPLPVTAFVVLCLAVANVINIGADAAAMGAATRMLIGGPATLYATVFVIVGLGLQIFVRYDRYAGVLKWSTLVLFTYFATPLLVDVDWGEAIWSTLVPRASLDAEHLTALTAVLGTTISPYLVFWQASQVAEEVRVEPRAKTLRRAPHQAPRALERIRADTYSGMIASNLIAFFIMLTCAATLHAHGVTEVQSTEDVARALEPIAGRFASLLFTLGVVGTGMLAIPVLAGAAAYALAEIFGWRASLEARWDQAKPFYALLAGVTLVGLGIAAAPINPVRALYWSAVINGVAAVPVLAATVYLAASPAIMGKRFAVSGWLRAMGWLTATVMAVAAVGLVALR
jgi:NRAMP (natural resistance-associated macrophage protein)-like metal ion transporter